MQHRTRVPVLPDVAARILHAAARAENGCLVSAIHPSQKRPSVKIPGGTMVLATRIVMAVALGRCIEPTEDVHHRRCRTIRCVEPTHLAVIPEAEHRAHHGAERRRQICRRHQRPYDGLDVNGANYCRKCSAEASVRYRRNHPDYRRPPLTEAQRVRRNEWARLRRQEPEVRAKERARGAARRADPVYREQARERSRRWREAQKRAEPAA